MVEKPSKRALPVQDRIRRILSTSRKRRPPHGDILLEAARTIEYNESRIKAYQKEVSMLRKEARNLASALASRGD